MGTLLEVPNTHAVRDPTWGRASIQKHYSTHLSLLDELIAFGVDLLMRAMETSGNARANGYILSVLYRQTLVAADSAKELITCGAIDGSQIQIRSLMEARWGLMLALRYPAKWGAHIRIASLVEQLSLTLRMIPGTREYSTDTETRELAKRYDGPQPSAEEAERSRDAINALLDSDSDAAIVDGFRKYASVKKHSALWYYDPNAPKAEKTDSVWSLASRVETLGEYKTLYRHASYYMHGGYSGTHLKQVSRGTIISPLCTAEGARQAILLTYSMLIDAIRRIIEMWRPDEMTILSRKYVEEWRESLHAMPEIEVEINRAVNR